MGSKQNIYEFILKWYNKFTQKNLLKNNIDYHLFGVEYTLLNIEKNMIKPDINTLFFKELWKIKDVNLLLNICYEIWERFYKENEEFNEIWIANNIKIFRRILVLLKSGDYKKFSGKIKEFTLTSSNLYYEQELDIKDAEQVFAFDGEKSLFLERYTLYQEEIYSDDFVELDIENRDKEKIVTILEGYFSRENLEINQEIGDWRLVLTNEEGEEFCYCGSYMPYSFEENDNISETIRELCNEELFLFDNIAKIDSIDKIELFYTRIQETITVEESLIIDRNKGSIEYTQKKGEDESYKRYIRKNELTKFLDSFDLDNFLKIKLIPPSDILKNPLNKKRYSLKIKYKYQKEYKLNGDYHRCDLPSDWGEFLEKLNVLVKEDEMDIFNKEIYDKIPLRKNQYIYCQIEFYENTKKYYYRTTDDGIMVGDKVIVPVNRYNSELHGKVVSVEYYFEKELPYPLEDTKIIIRKI